MFMEEVADAPSIIVTSKFDEQLASPKQVSTWARLRKSPGAMIGLIIIVILLLTALFSEFLAPQGIDEQDLRQGLLPPSREYPMGTDEFGRDMLSRVIHGSPEQWCEDATDLLWFNVTVKGETQHWQKE